MTTLDTAVVRTLRKPRKQRWGLLLALTAILAVSVTVATVAAEQSPPKAEALSCVAGIIAGGVGVITAVGSVGIVPFIEILAYGAAAFGLGDAIQNCQTQWLKGVINNWSVRWCASHYYFYGWKYDFWGRRISGDYHLTYTGVCTGGGGGSSGSW